MILATKAPNLGLASRHFGEGEKAAQSDLRGNYPEMFSSSLRLVLTVISAIAEASAVAMP